VEEEALASGVQRPQRATGDHADRDGNGDGGGGECHRLGDQHPEGCPPADAESPAHGDVVGSPHRRGDERGHERGEREDGEDDGQEPGQRARPQEVGGVGRFGGRPGVQAGAAGGAEPPGWRDGPPRQRIAVIVSGLVLASATAAYLGQAVAKLT
jgi:hypothetical protein